MNRIEFEEGCPGLGQRCPHAPGLYGVPAESRFGLDHKAWIHFHRQTRAKVEGKIGTHQRGGCMAKSGVPHLKTLSSNTRKEPDDNDLKIGLVSQSVEWFNER